MPPPRCRRRRIVRLLARAGVNAGTAASLLLCVAAAVLWARSHRGEDARSFRLGGGGGPRYTVRSAGGRVTLYAPPPEPAGAAGAEARELAAKLNNEHVEWRDHADGPYVWLSDDVSRRLASVGQAARPALLTALDDSGRWVAAYVCLSAPNSPRTPWYFYSGPRPRFKADNFHGLHVTFTSAGATVIDPADQPILIDRWHRALDVKVAHVPHAALVAALALCPAGRLTLALRRRQTHRRRHREGRCPACGYDCRATPGRCPECGPGRRAA